VCRIDEVFSIRAPLVLRPCVAIHELAPIITAPFQSMPTSILTPSRLARSANSFSMSSVDMLS